LKRAGTREMADVPEGADFWATRAPAASLVCCEPRFVVSFNIFTPDTCLSSIRAVLANPAAWDYCISQINIESAYPNKHSSTHH